MQVIAGLHDRLLQLAAYASAPWWRGRLSILIYHRVHPVSEPLFPEEVNAATFAWQMALLQRHCQVLSLADAVTALQTATLPARAVCITFDDGYADNADVALPILQQIGVPATFFIASGYLNGGRMWNDTVIETIRRLPGPLLDLRHWGLASFALTTVAERRQVLAHVLRHIKPLSLYEREQRLAELTALLSRPLPTDLMLRTDQVQTLHRAGMEIGGHTVHHPILASEDPATARQEILQNRAELAALVGAPIRFFAYPNGRPCVDYTAAHVAMVRDAGFTAALSTAWGVSTPHSDVWQLPRFTPWDQTPSRYLLRLLANCRRTCPTLAH